VPKHRHRGTGDARAGADLARARQGWRIALPRTQFLWSALRSWTAGPIRARIHGTDARTNHAWVADQAPTGPTDDLLRPRQWGGAGAFSPPEARNGGNARGRDRVGRWDSGRVCARRR